MHFRELPKKITGCDDPNVEIVSGMLDTAQQRKLLQRADCYVFPSRGEGWGSPPREAAATGLPVIATNWGGLAEDIEYWAMPVQVRGMSPADYGFWDAGEIGEWAEPNTDEVVERMKWCFENQRSAANFGRNAAEWLRSYSTYDHTAKTILEIVNAD
jgi:glycosyltransferase involved in cell wall biosynthesis